MRIATWNINGLRARIDFVKHWLDARQPDVVGLQELKVDEPKFPYEEFEAVGYRAVVHAQKGWNGVAVLAREGTEVVQSGLPGEEEFGARLIRGRVGGLDFTTVYCPNGKTIEHEDYPRKLVWYESLVRWVQESLDPDDPCVLCGDFNLCPQPIDSWHEDPGSIFHTEEERTRFQALLDWGFVDLYRHLHPEEQKFSWWDYRGGAFHRNMGLRIDFVLGTEAVVRRTTHAETDRDYRKKKDGLIASDHAPVLVDLEPT